MPQGSKAFKVNTDIPSSMTWLFLLLLLSGAYKCTALRCHGVAPWRDLEAEAQVQTIFHLTPNNVSKAATSTKYKVTLNETKNSLRHKAFKLRTDEEIFFHDLDLTNTSKTQSFSFPNLKKYLHFLNNFYFGRPFSIILPFESTSAALNPRLKKRFTRKRRSEILGKRKIRTKLARSAGQDSRETTKTARTEDKRLERSKYSQEKKSYPPECEDKQDLDACLDKALLNLSVEGLPHTKDQLMRVCSAFKRGMSCVDAFTSRCFSEERRREFEANMAGARAFLAFLCDDAVFQRDYLSHGPCIGKVGAHWQGCNDRFKYLVGKELRRSPSDLEGDTRRWKSICCLRQKLLSCVYHVGLSYCSQGDAVFLKKVSSALSYHSAKRLNCDSAACSGASRAETPVQLLLRWSSAYLQLFL